MELPDQRAWKPNAIFCFLFFQNTNPLWEWSFCPTSSTVLCWLSDQLGRFSTSMVPLGDVSCGCVHPSKTKLLLLVPDGVCLCLTLKCRRNSPAPAQHMSCSSSGWVPELLATAWL